jgi:response regulator NasT
METTEMSTQSMTNTVVLCEDEAMTVVHLKKILEREGFRVVAISSDGRDAVDQVLRERPGVVLMDINLPNMDGIEATRRILGTYRTYRPCIVMVTAYADEEHRARALAAGAYGYVVKPFSPRELVQQVKEAVSRCEEERVANLLSP